MRVCGCSVCVGGERWDGGHLGVYPVFLANSGTFHSLNPAVLAVCLLVDVWVRDCVYLGGREGLNLTALCVRVHTSNVTPTHTPRTTPTHRFALKKCTQQPSLAMRHIICTKAASKVCRRLKNSPTRSAKPTSLFCLLTHH